MNITKLSSKGQVILPAALRAARAWSAGTEFELRETLEDVLIKPLANLSPFAPTRLQDVSGTARRQRPALSVEDMHATVQAEAARQI